MSVETMKQALEALETEQALRQGYSYRAGVRIVSTADEAINALRTAIQQADVTDHVIRKTYSDVMTALREENRHVIGGAVAIESDMPVRFARAILALRPASAPMTDVGVYAMRYALEWIARVNAMDYEYQRVAKEALSASAAQAKKEDA